MLWTCSNFLLQMSQIISGRVQSCYLLHGTYIYLSFPPNTKILDETLLLGGTCRGVRHHPFVSDCPLLPEDWSRPVIRASQCERRLRQQSAVNEEKWTRSGAPYLHYLRVYMIGQDLPPIRPTKTSAPLPTWSHFERLRCTSEQTEAFPPNTSP